MTRFALAAMAVVALASAGRASDEFSAPPDPDDAAKTVCQLIDESAAAHALPVEFLTRLIWKESRFRANAVSPKGAQGIAQFMPGTAALRGLTDPFDPASAIPAAAHYLSDLSNGFGNLGLAAAAYNGGERRVAEWLAGTGGLPWETRDFVHFITGRPAEDWKSRLSEGVDDDEPAPTTCAEVAAIVSKPGAGAVPVAAAGETAAWAPWGVQVAGNFSEARARASYASLQRRYPSLLADRPPLVLRSVMRGRGTAPFTRIRLAAATRDEAERLCAQLRKAGGACVVLKN